MAMYQSKQSVTKSLPTCAVSELLRAQRPQLSTWYATPLTDSQLAQLLSACQQELQTRLCNGGSCFALHVLQLVCRFRQQAGVELAYQQLRTSAQDVSEQALLELVYGQLLTSRKMTGAHRHLADGFSLAAPVLSSTEYFQLVRRHELLGWLALSDVASAPQALAALLAEAAVIKKLQGGAALPRGSAHRDTLG